MVVFLDDALGERQSESPTALFGRIARSEHVFHVFFLDSLARVGHFHDHAPHFHAGKQCDFALAFHCIDGIFAEILDDPLEKRRIQRYDDVVGRKNFH